MHSQSITPDLFGEEPTKFCPRCKIHLPLGEFYLQKARKSGKQYRCTYCKACNKQKVHLFHHTPKGQEVHRRNGLKSKFGITPEDYDAMLKKQNGVCAICGKIETRLNRRGTIRVLSIDHNHESGSIRGLLCSSCNNGLGYFGDQPELLRTALAYLAKYGQS